MPVRKISIDFLIDPDETHRATAMGFFKPKILYTLSVTRNSITRKIDCYLATKVNYRQSNINLPIYVTLELICPTPYFRQENPTLVSPVAHVATIDNIGDVPCGFICTITATGGAVISPTIVNAGSTAGIVWNGTLANTDVAVFSTVPGNKYVTIEGVVSYLYDVGSTFWELVLGSQTITDYAGTGTAYLIASYAFWPLYLGV